MIYSSGYATARHLKAIGFDRTAFAVGSDGLIDELRGQGIEAEGGSTYAKTKASPPPPVPTRSPRLAALIPGVHQPIGGGGAPGERTVGRDGG